MTYPSYGGPPRGFIAIPIMILANLAFVSIVLGDTSLVGFEWVGFAMLTIYVIALDSLLLELIIRSLNRKEEHA